jgi:hypothetical protein
MRRPLAIFLLPAFVLAGCQDGPTGPEASAPEGLDVAAFNIFDEDQGTGLEVSSSSSFFPASTNELNRDQLVPSREGQDAPFVVFAEIDVGRVTLHFVNNTNSLAFFEYRIDGETVGTNPHPVVSTGFVHPTTGETALLDDVIHPGVSLDGRGIADPVETTRTFTAEETVEIRLALGGERDWDFDWTTFFVPTTADARDRCRGGGWQDLGFRNQGACIQDANQNRTTVLATGHATALGEWSNATWDIELDFEVLEQRDEIRGTVRYMNHTASTAFVGEATCFALIGDPDGFGDHAVFGATATAESDWDHLVFYLQDNGPGGSVAPRDRFRPVPSDASADSGCDVEATERFYDVFEGNLRLHDSE